MVKTAEQARTFLASTGVLQSTAPNERCVVVLPTASSRFNAAQIALTLHRNGIKLRVLGRGAGKVREVSGKERTVKDCLVLALSLRDLKRASMYARLFGSHIVEIPR